MRAGQVLRRVIDISWSNNGHTAWLHLECKHDPLHRKDSSLSRGVMTRAVCPECSRVQELKNKVNGGLKK
jgi:hypothetical protein